MLQFRFLWQISKEKKEADFLITKMAVPFTFYQVFYIIASVVKLSWNSLDASLWSFVIAHNICHTGKSYSYTGAVFISKTFLYIVFFIPFIWNIRIILGFSIKLCKITIFHNLFFSPGMLSYCCRFCV